MRAPLLSLCAGMLLAACRMQPEPDAAALLDREWRLVERAGVAVTLPRPPTLRLERDEARASGHGGCNRYFGSYTLAADGLAFGRMGSTMMACVEGMDVERDYLADLVRVTHWRVVEGRLQLLAAGRPLLVFAGNKEE